MSWPCQAKMRGDTQMNVVDTNKVNSAKQFAMDDFYYNFNNSKILSKSNPDFFIHHFPGRNFVKRGKTYKFVLKLGDFSFSFFGANTCKNTDWNFIAQSQQCDGIATIPFDLVGSALKGSGRVILNMEFLHFNYNYPQNKFESMAHQQQILDLFARALLAFPATFAIESRGSCVFYSTTQDNERVDGYEYGARIKFTDKVMKQLANGEFVK